MSRERTDSGQYPESVTPEAVLGVFELVDGPVVTSGDVAEALDCSRETARRKLGRLESEGLLASRKTAGRIVCWRTEDGHARGVDPDDRYWELEPGSSGESDISERVDDVLYGDG